MFLYIRLDSLGGSRCYFCIQHPCREKALQEGSQPNTEARISEQPAGLGGNLVVGPGQRTQFTSAAAGRRKEAGGLGKEGFRGKKVIRIDADQAPSGQCPCGGMEGE